MSRLYETCHQTNSTSQTGPSKTLTFAPPGIAPINLLAVPGVPRTLAAPGITCAVPPIVRRGGVVVKQALEALVGNRVTVLVGVMVLVGNGVAVLVGVDEVSLVGNCVSVPGDDGVEVEASADVAANT